LAEKGAEVAIRLRQGRFRRALFLGVGGSASAGDIISGWMSIRHRLPFSVYKGYVPERDLRGTLAIACSASGETKETLRMTEWAIRRGAYVVSLSSGGRLAALSKKKRIPHVELPEIVAPRYVLPFLLFATISILREKFELVGVEEEVRDAIREMRELVRRVEVTVPVSRNESKQLARALLKPTPKIYGSTVTRGAARRFKNALNENAKKHASVDFAPELFHNEIEAWEGGGDNFLPIFLRHPKEPAS
jgi:glucose/mannose-6-phosphate isomerase